MSLMGSLGIGVRGLSASQLALNVTGQNISNANTEGYSRKRLELSAATRRDGWFGEMGFGVEIESVKRVTDHFLETQIREQLTDQGYFDVQDGALERIENILSEPNDSGLNEAIDKFWNSWQDLSNNPEDPASREVVRSSALVLEDKFHTISRELQDYRSSMNQDIEGTVNQVNGLIDELFSLNNEVAVGEIRGGEANDSRDRRDQLVQRLSTIIDVDVIEDDLGRITLTTAGNLLVGPSNAIHLELMRKSIVDVNGQDQSVVLIQFGNTRKDYMPRGGTLRSLFDVRDAVIPKYQSEINKVSEAIVRTVNETHYTGYNLKGNTGLLFFEDSQTRADNLSLSAAIRETSDNIAAAAGGNSIPVLGAVSFVPPAATPQLDLKTIELKYHDIAVGSMKITWNGLTLDEGAGKDYVVDYEQGTINFLNYARYNPADALKIDFRYNETGFSGPGDGSNAMKIAQLRDAYTMVENSNGDNTKTIGEYYSSLIGVLGIERNQARANAETRNFLVDQFQSRKAAVSGVSLDEELANMIKFEHTYQASARYISAINTILDVLMNI